jgi:phospholipid transport system substrate-binding protein
MYIKKLCIALILCLAFISTPVLADDKEDAGTFANDLGHKALAIISDKSSSKEDVRSKLEALFQQNVDIDWIGKFVLGRYWRDATDEQKEKYLANYKTFLISHYTSNFSEFSNANFQVTKTVPEERGGYTVTMRIKRPNAEDVVVDYTIRKKEGDSLRVYDIVVEGVSMITTQRSEFSSVASQKGLDYLIEQLAERSKKDEQNPS